MWSGCRESSSRKNIFVFIEILLFEEKHEHNFVLIKIKIVEL